MKTLHRDERGGALVETPLAIAIILLLAMGVTTLVQVAWTHLALSSAVRATTRYATHVEYDPSTGGIDRHRTDEQVRAWAEEVAAEAHVAPEDVTITGRRVPSGAEVPIDQLVAGDEIVVTVVKVVNNPLYGLAAAVTNTVSHVVGGGDVFNPDGIGIEAGATSFVE
jgi:Flp pilus assembly protein TadG